MGAAGIRVGWILASRDNLWAGLEQRRRNLDIEYGYKDIVSPDRGLAIDFGVLKDDVACVSTFTTSDIVEYFAQLSKQIAYKPSLPIVEEEGAVRILEVTQGVPLAVKIAADLYLREPDLDKITGAANSKQEIVGQMVERYLLHAHDDQSERAQLYGLALLRRVDQPAAVVAAMDLPPEEAHSSFEIELSRLHRRYSFIFTEKERPSLHQEVRYFLRLWLLEHCRDPEIMSVNERLREAHETALKKLEDRRQYGGLRERLEDEEWVGVYLDLIEQQFWLDPAEGVRYSLPFMLAAYIYQRDANIDVAEVGMFFKTHISQPYLNWWTWVDLSLINTTSRNLPSEVLTGLEQLIELVKSSRLAIPQFLPDSRVELEAALWWRLGEAYQDRDEIKAENWYEKALTVLSQQAEIRKSAAEAYANMASTLHEKKKLIESISFLNRAIELNPDYPIVYNYRGLVYSDLKDYQQAIEDFGYALILNPNLASAYYNRGTAYSALKEYQRAIEDFDRSIALNPKDAFIYYNRGTAYSVLKEYQRAIEDFDLAILLDRKDIFYYHRGIAHAVLKDSQRALKDPNVHAFITIEDENKLKGYRHAIEDFDRAIALNPNNANFYNSRGLTYRMLKDYEHAIEDFDLAIALNTGFASAYYNRGLTYLQLRETKQACADLNRCFELAPEDINAAWMAEWAKMSTEHYDSEMAKRLGEISEIEQQHYVAYICRGVALGLRNELREALIEVEKAIQLEPKECDAYFWKGMICAYLGRYSMAIEALEQSLKEGLLAELLKPLRWLEKDRPIFYKDYAETLLAYRIVI